MNKCITIKSNVSRQLISCKKVSDSSHIWPIPLHAKRAVYRLFFSRPFVQQVSACVSVCTCQYLHTHTHRQNKAEACMEAQRVMRNQARSLPPKATYTRKTYITATGTSVLQITKQLQYSIYAGVGEAL